MVVKIYQYVNELIPAYVRLSIVDRNMGEGALDFMEIFFFQFSIAFKCITTIYNFPIPRSLTSLLAFEYHV